jgi:hypothetical protein
MGVLSSWNLIDGDGACHCQEGQTWLIYIAQLPSQPTGAQYLQSTPATRTPGKGRQKVGGILDVDT